MADTLNEAGSNWLHDNTSNGFVADNLGLLTGVGPGGVVDRFLFGGSSTPVYKQELGGMTDAFLTAFVEKFPQAKTSWAEAVRAGDKTDFGRWLATHVQNFPDSDYAKYVNAYRVNPIDATNALINENKATTDAKETARKSGTDWDEYLTRPAVQKWYKEATARGESYATPEDFAQAYYANIGQQAGDTLKTIGETGGTAQPKIDGTPAKGGQGTMTADQYSTTTASDVDLLNQVMNKYVLPGIEEDATTRKATADELLAKYKSDFSKANDTTSKLFSNADWAGYLAANPDLKAQAEAAVASGKAASPDEWAKYYYEHTGVYEAANGTRKAPTGANSAYLDQELATSGAADAAQKEALKKQVADTTTALDTAKASSTADINTYADSSQGNVNKQLASYQSGFNTMSADQKAALADRIAKLQASQTAVDAERINAAKQQQTAINLGLQSTNDQIAAQTAANGYLGGASTGTDMALARAAIGARQGAAGAMSNAKLENSTDWRSLTGTTSAEENALAQQLAADQYGITRFGADQTRGVSDTKAGNLFNLGNSDTAARLQLAQYAAGENRGITDATTGRTMSLTEDDIKRQITGAALPISLTNAYAESLKNLDDYKQTGIQNGLKLLNFWRTSADTPTYTTTSNTANTAMGNAYGSLGAGLTSFGTALGMNGLFKSGTGTGATAANTAGTTAAVTGGTSKSLINWSPTLTTGNFSTWKPGGG